MRRREEQLGCIDEDTALSLLRGALTSDEADQVHGHIADCTDCRRLMSALATSSVDMAAVEVRTPERLDDAPSRHSATQVAPGTRIGRFEILELLGRGGMGAVFLAKDDDLQRKVALKLLHSTTPDAAARLLTEARNLARLRHPNVVTVYDVGRDGDDVYVAMEYVSGQTLRRWLRGDRTIEQRVEAIRAAGAGLSAAHDKGLVHRDFKPENVMVGNDGRVQVLDFGLAKGSGPLSAGELDVGDSSTPHSRSMITQAGALVGTPAYMAPERFRLEAAGARTDQFAFCVVLYEAVQGARPFSGDTIEDLHRAIRTSPIRASAMSDAVPAAVATAIAKGLSKSPADRFDSMAPLLEMLGSAYRPSTPRLRDRWFRLSLVAALLCVGGVVAWWGNGPPKTARVDRQTAVVAASNLPPTRRTPLDHDPFAVTVHRLDNGLTIFASRNQDIPRIAVRLVIRAGSRDDPMGHSGVAHLARRMMDRGTEALGTRDYTSESKALKRVRRLSADLDETTDADERKRLEEAIEEARFDAAQWALPDEFRRLSTAIGIDVNTTLHPRATIFSAEMPSERFAQWAMLEGERWSRPVARTFNSEVDAAARADSSDLHTFDRHLYRNHPYGRPPHGLIDELNASALRAVEAFMAQRYVPNNAALVIAGDIDMIAALPILQKAFARWRPRPSVAHPHRVPDALTQNVSVEARDRTMRYVALLGREASSFEPRDAVVEVTKKLLASPDLWTDRNALDGAKNVRLTIDRARETRSWALEAEPEPGQSLDAVVVAIDHRLAALERAEFEANQIDGMLSRSRIRYNATGSNNATRATRIAAAYADQGRWPTAHALNDAKPVTTAELRALVHHLRTAPRVVLQVERGPSVDPRPKRHASSRPAKVDTAWSAFAARLLADRPAERPVRFVWPGRDYHIASRPWGELITVPNVEDEIFEVAFEWRVGWRAMPDLCVALAALDRAGVGDVTAAERKRRWARELFSATISCERDLTSVVMRGHADHLDNVATVVALLRGVELTDSIVADATKRYAANLSETVAVTLTETLAHYALTGEPMARVPSNPPNADAARATLASLLATRRTTRFFGPDPDSIFRFVPRDGPALEAPSLTTLDEIGIRPRFVVLDDRNASTAVVQVFRVLRPLTEPSVPSLQLFEAVAKRRVQRALPTAQATVRVEYQPRAEDGARIRIAFVTDAPRIHEHLRRLDSLLLDTPVDPDEFDAARSEVEAAYLRQWIPPRDLTAQLASWRLRGLEGDPRPQRYAIVKGMDAGDVDAFARRLQEAPEVIVIMANQSALDTSAFATRGEVIGVTRGELSGP